MKCNAMPLFFVYETCYMRLLWLNLLRCIGMLTLLRRWLFSIDLLDTPKCGVDILNVFNGLVKVKKKIVKSWCSKNSRSNSHRCVCTNRLAALSPVRGKAPSPRAQNVQEVVFKLAAGTSYCAPSTRAPEEQEKVYIYIR